MMSGKSAVLLVGLLAFATSIGLVMKENRGGIGKAAVSSVDRDVRSIRPSSFGQARAETVSRKTAEDVVRVAVHAPDTAPTFSALMTWSRAASVFNLDRSHTPHETKLIWIVTVKTRVRTDGGPAAPPDVKRFYSAVVDAGSRRIIDECIGCAWLGKSA
jgi:hypothetical protein